MTEVSILLPRKNFDVAINEAFTGGITGIYGPSGSGKTSLLHAIAGLAHPAKGEIKINGKTLFDSAESINLPPEKRNIGYVFQEGRLFPHMTVKKNLLYGIKKKVTCKVSFDEVVEMLNLGHVLSSKPSQISGGERQRTALGRSLLSSPQILLLDEPFSAVDTSLRQQILPFILRIQLKVKIPILVVSHDLPDLLKLTDDLFIMKEGQCLGHGMYYQLIKDPEISGIFAGNALVNAIKMVVSKVIPNEGLTRLSWQKNGCEVNIKCEKSRKTYQKGQTVKIFINADDIALSKFPLDHVTIQNQIQGTVTDIIQQDGNLLCIVDVGFRLVVEITENSQKRLDISAGSAVWCLFKSAAIDVAG